MATRPSTQKRSGASLGYLIVVWQENGNVVADRTLGLLSSAKSRPPGISRPDLTSLPSRRFHLNSAIARTFNLSFVSSLFASPHAVLAVLAVLVAPLKQ